MRVMATQIESGVARFQFWPHDHKCYAFRPVVSLASLGSLADPHLAVNILRSSIDVSIDPKLIKHLINQVMKANPIFPLQISGLLFLLRAQERIDFAFSGMITAVGLLLGQSDRLDKDRRISRHPADQTTTHQVGLETTILGNPLLQSKKDFVSLICGSVSL